jgi:hypothetical protein
LADIELKGKQKMKKAFVLSLLIIFLTFGSAFAADECVQTGPTAYGGHSASFSSVSFACNGDASAGTAFTGMDSLYGMVIYSVETVPGSGAAEPSAYTVTLKNARGANIVPLSARSATAGEYVDIADEIGGYPLVNSALTLVTGDLGAGNTATVVVTFYRIPKN